jgi:hypothetical protein
MTHTLTLQLATGDKQFYVIGAYIPPNHTREVEDLKRVVKACPAGCKLLVMGDLHVNIGFPQDKREEVIVDLLDKANLVDTLRGFLAADSAQDRHQGTMNVKLKKGDCAILLTTKLYPGTGKGMGI